MAHGTLQGWHADPFGLHERRYFSAGQPTKLVRDGDAESYDEPPREAAPEPADEVAAAADSSQEPADPVSSPSAPALTTAPVADASTPAASDASTPAAAPGASSEAADPGSADSETSPADSVESYLGVLLRRRPRGLVYAVVGLVAVVAVLAVVAITGGFSSHPVPGTFGAPSRSDSVLF